MDSKPVNKGHANLIPAKKGEIRNPEGGRSHNPAIRALRNLTLEQYREVIEKVLTGNVAELQAMIKNPRTTAIQVGVAACFLKAIKDGDFHIIEKIAERIVGKVPDVLNVNSKNATVVAKVDQAKLKAALEALEDDV